MTPAELEESFRINSEHAAFLDANPEWTIQSQPLVPLVDAPEDLGGTK